VRGADDVVLDLKVIEQELHRQVVVRLDPAHLRGREDDHSRLLLREKTIYIGFNSQIELGAIARHDTGKGAALEFADQGASDQASMTGDEYFFRFFHNRSDDCGLAFSFLGQCAILSSWEKTERGWEFRKPISSLSAESLFGARAAAFSPRAEMIARSLRIIAGLPARISGMRSWRLDWISREAENSYCILDTIEMKTAWHPVGL
jgi:hypothetical protein